MTPSPPRCLNLEGKPINFAGPGRSPGAQAYVDPGRGKVIEIYAAQVISLAPTFCLASVINNRALPAVRVNYRDLKAPRLPQVGELYLIGPLTFPPSGPCARAAWPVKAHAPNGHGGSPARVGVITSLMASHWGFVTPLGSGQQALVHRNHCPPGMTLRLGKRIRYAELTTPRGQLAVEVHAA